MKINELHDAIEAGNTELALALTKEIKDIGRSFSQTVVVKADGSDIEVNQGSGSGDYRVITKRQIQEIFGGY